MTEKAEPHSAASARGFLPGILKVFFYCTIKLPEFQSAAPRNLAVRQERSGTRKAFLDTGPNRW